MKKIPAETSSGVKLGSKNFWLVIPIILCVMYGGNIIGTILSYILSGGTAQNPLESYILNNDIVILRILVIAILLILKYTNIMRKKKRSV